MKKKDRIINSIKKQIGGENNSAEGVARALMLRTEGEMSPTGQTMRRWFAEKSIPIRELCIMVDLANLPYESVIAFHPWMRQYFRPTDT